MLERIAVLTGYPLTELISEFKDGKSPTERAALEVRLYAAGKALTLEQLRIVVLQIEALRSNG